MELIHDDWVVRRVEFVPTLIKWYTNFKWQHWSKNGSV